jgi:hypothetical protein
VIGIYIKRSEQATYFNISNIVFEKDVLMQNLLYRRAMIKLDNGKYQSAAKDFTAAIVIHK